jgi:hypothetical protein
MDAVTKLKQYILQHADIPVEPDETIEDVWGDRGYDDAVYDARYEAREGEVETDIPCEWSRHYESKSVAAKMLDGSWVGWTYWYGGGKHGEPWAIDWIEDAYNLSCTEEEKLVLVRTFTKE